MKSHLRNAMSQVKTLLLKDHLLKTAQNQNKYTFEEVHHHNNILINDL